MNAFLHVLSSCNNVSKRTCLRRGKPELLQVNMGDLCNQQCTHCHINARPQGKKIMPRPVIDSILQFLADNKELILDITGGAPELNPHFDYFVTKACPLVKKLIVRSNLTVLFEPGKDYLPKFFKAHRVHLICSLPCYLAENVDRQRGSGTFDKSIRALQLLNKQGYGLQKDLILDLVYNPAGPVLPPRQDELEKQYKQVLKEKYGISFNKLITITNAPIKRFKDSLDTQNVYNDYMNTLKDNFNPSVVYNLMCKTFLSVGYDGKLYDCDFNQALGWELKDSDGTPLTLDCISIKDFIYQDIMVGEHCFTCTAGGGSSCKGALDK